jgi:hypothetical protein
MAAPVETLVVLERIDEMTLIRKIAPARTTPIQNTSGMSAARLSNEEDLTAGSIGAGTLAG